MKTVLTLLLAPLSLCARITELPREQPQKIVMLSVPKAGTSLVETAMRLITGRDVKAIVSPALADPKVNPEIALDPEDPNIGMHHLFPSFNFIKEDKSGRYIKIIQIRDPRDVLLAKMKWIKLGHWYAPKDFIREFNDQPFNDKLTGLIQFPDEYWSTRVFLRLALEWMKEPDVLVCRFEELVGPQGGGNQERQHAAIAELAKHMGYSLDPEDIERIGKEVFGKGGTFMKGQIGEWHKYYTEGHKALFKQEMGQELIALGYEIDDNW